MLRSVAAVEQRPWLLLALVFVATVFFGFLVQALGNVYLRWRADPIVTEYRATLMEKVAENSTNDLMDKFLENGALTDDELRKILVRAGAVRIFRDDNSEWWRLLSRMDEYITKRSK